MPRQPAAAFVLLLVVTGAAGENADAVKELTARAEKGQAQAQYELGRRCAAGQGVPKDEAAALRWFQKAAAQDHAGALVQLGSFYAHGFGVKQDWAESIRWYRRAALQGDPTALHNLGLDYAHGHGVERDARKAAHWFRLAAEQGHARAQYNLGELTEEGRGVAKSDADAYVLYHLASAHDNLEHLFGQPKMIELIQKRDRVAKRLTAAQLAEGRRRVRAAETLEAVHPRLFGTAANVAPSRGWYIWRSFNPGTWEAEVGREDTNEVWKARVLPWVSTYRYLVYGARPDALLPGERVNLFFSPDENNRRGYLVYFQDELCQMKGHGHYWQVQKVDPGGRTFTARDMAGDKPLHERVPAFEIDPTCQAWHGGKRVEQYPLASAGKLYLTWVQRGERRVVLLMSDDGSLDAIKKQEEIRVAEQIAADGIAGQVQSVDGDTVHFMVFSSFWQQGNQVAPGMAGSLRETGTGYRPTGEPVSVHVLSRKNRGLYGSGVNDVLLRLDRPEEARRVEGWRPGAVVRFRLTPPKTP